MRRMNTKLAEHLFLDEPFYMAEGKELSGLDVYDEWDFRRGGFRENWCRLQRDVRDIAEAFLVDMSSSTEGWVNRALKEALEVLGDWYAIYGFSGCITIDKTAHDYIGHMYGAMNYIFIDNVLKLPLRMPEIYRNLTT